MLAALLCSLALPALGPLVHRFARGAGGWVLGALAAALAARFALFLPTIAAGGVVRTSWAWAPSLGVNLSLQLDGLSLVFALLICGIGALVTIYAGRYLAGHPQLGLFYAYLLAFMASMLGTVLVDNLLVLYVFWELTSFTSYLLIGFNQREPGARRAALQALLVTGAGGLAMLAGFTLLGLAAGSFEISVLAERGAAIRAHPLYIPSVVLILAGALTKSAQFPFHFWLPNAMAAPTPVSAYLHSSTMVKAGVYLLARLSPVLAGTALWSVALPAFGAVTMIVGAALALLHTDLKRILAYTTLSVLGTLTMLLGFGTDAAVEAAMVLLVAHALYKGALFLIAGVVDHETGARDVRALGGLARAMPVTAVIAGLAALSNAGVPAFVGFVSKEMLYEATRSGPGGILLLALTVLAKAALVATAIIVGIRPFTGARPPTPRQPHEPPPSLLLGPAVLALAGLALGIAPATAESLLRAAASAVGGGPSKLHLAPWHGFNLVLVLSAVTLLLGLAAYGFRGRIRRAAPLDRAARFGPDRAYDIGLAGLLRFASGLTRLLQNGYLRYYLAIIVLTVVALAGPALVWGAGSPLRFAWTGAALYEWITVVLVLVGALVTVSTRSRLTAVAALGVVGYGLGLVYLLYSAPDLAITQFAIETLTVVLFVLVLYRLPPFAKFSTSRARIRDAAVAVAGGALMAGLLLMTLTSPADSQRSAFFAENSYLLAHGRNVVNVILVDFRAMDTLGEITVLAVAGIGVFALLGLLPGSRRKENEK